MESKEEKHLIDFIKSSNLKLESSEAGFITIGFREAIEWQKTQQKPITVERIIELTHGATMKCPDILCSEKECAINCRHIVKAARQIYSELQPIEEGRQIYAELKSTEEEKSDAIDFKEWCNYNYRNTSGGNRFNTDKLYQLFLKSKTIK